MVTNRITYLAARSVAPAHIAAQTAGRAKSRCYISLCTLLLTLLLTSCGGSPSTPTPIPPPMPTDFPGYPNLSGSVTVADAGSFPQHGQYDAVQAVIFASTDNSDTLRAWYKDQLAAKGWQVVADAPNLLGLTPPDRSKLIELFISANSSGTKVLAYYASGRKPTPMP